LAGREHGETLFVSRFYCSCYTFLPAPTGKAGP
jgi:hypothetical protein